MKNNLTDRERALYAAGIFDGEGCITMNPPTAEGRTTYALVMVVTNTNLELIEWLQQNFGGLVRDCGVTVGRKQKYSWTLNGRKCQPFIEAVFSFLIVKRPQAIIALNFLYDEWYFKKGKQYFEQIRALNKGIPQEKDEPQI